ncbi:RNB domain-containing ribonuclease [Nocardioides albus]|uniref:VacB/RNase II family 3'-5' exoribonuclease n=1 Tax=Nocardioides albus TaxID=1841 RepID=A0A7W5A5M1_9ACTN|nr:RNB domain-containing ribonuclease [Nocardioides albus]MBB3089928.1 VacB/RNase II family 3'-5' exoribonuclease [Nocardioides albus]GGU36634.1 ribonuclease R [Nocardioides albus]
MGSARIIRVASADSGVAATTLRDGIAALQAELGVTAEFPREVEEAAAIAAANPRLPELDRTDLPFVTIDPETSMDLDQALHLERDGDGYVVHYAIADVAAFVAPGDPVDLEANKRGETLYAADAKIPLHPKVLSEDAASLLPDQVRPALLWTHKLDAAGEGTDTVVERALVRSRAKLSYEGVQKMFDGDGFGDADYAESLELLKEVGEKRIALEAARGGVNLPLRDQEISVEGDHWSLEYRDLLPVENWNAQISLLTGFAAADLMVYARVGLLRTLPEPDPRDVQRLHRTARALGLEWPAEMLYPDFIRSLDGKNGKHAAMAIACTRLLRGSGYASFNGELPELTEHSALANEYMHVTAPLRRLIDRYAGEVCLALCADEPVPDWVTSAFKTLPETMRASSRTSGAYERGVVDLVEAGLLSQRVGETFAAVVVEVDDEDKQKGSITVEEPAIEARVTGTTALPLGEEVEVRLETADVVARKVSFTLA